MPTGQTSIIEQLRDMQVHFSSGKDDWETPEELFQRYNAIYHFTIDAAANEVNHKCPRWWGPGGEWPDALDVAWEVELAQGHNIWLNPPYSRGVQSKFVTKAHESMTKVWEMLWPLGRGSIVCLLPARTDTRLFHDIIQPHGEEIEFLRGRVKFVGAPNSAPFPSMVVIF